MINILLSIQSVPHKIVLDSAKTIIETRVVVDTLHLPANPTFELMSQVKGFYQDSWNNLIWVVGILFGLGGILIPIGIQMYQRWQLRLREEALNLKIDTNEKLFKDYITETETKIRADIKEEYELAMAEIIENSNKKLLELRQENIDSLKKFKAQNRINTSAMSYNFQSNIDDLRGNYALAILNAYKSLTFLFQLSSEHNIRISLNKLLGLMKKVEKDELDLLCELREIDMLQLLVELKSFEKAGDYIEKIDDIIETYQTLE